MGNQQNEKKTLLRMSMNYQRIKKMQSKQKQKELSKRRSVANEDRELAAAYLLSKLETPKDYSEKYLRILDKQKKLVPFIWNRAQLDFHRKRTKRNLILKSRQLGFSTYLQAELFRKAITRTYTTLTLSHNDDATQKLRLMADRYWENFVGEQPKRKYANAAMTTYPLHDSVAAIATAGNINTGRGDTYSEMHGSEVAFWKDAESIVVGAMQGGDPIVTLESTPNGAQGYFYQLCMEALDGNNDWTLHFYPWWWDVHYKIDGAKIHSYDEEEAELVKKHNLTQEQIAWRRLKKRELKQKFKQEYPEDPITCFLTSGNSYFGENLLTMFEAPMNVEYNPDHEYCAGLDFGQVNDFTAMPILDITARRQVDLLHINKLEWKEIRRRVVEKYNYWHCIRLGAESNSIGSVNIEALASDGVNVIPFETNNYTKSEWASDLYNAFDTGGWKFQPWEVQRHEYAIFVSTQLPSGVWRLAAEGDGHDDTVMGGMIALQTAITPIQIF